MYEYKIKSVDHIVDGDTLDVTVDLGFNISHKIRVRMYGINTPESRTRDLEEKKRGLAAKDRFIELLGEGQGLLLQTKEKGKYGRYLGIVSKENYPVSLNETLVAEGHAVSYFGGKR